MMIPPYQAQQTSTSMPFLLPRLAPPEHSRLLFQHHALRLGLDKLFSAPCKAPAAILDVACGGGIWTAEMGNLFPEASIIGLDIARPNCPQSPGFQFVQGRTLSSLPFEEARFDYVHQRCLGTVIPAMCWPGIVKELVRVTRPGGWVELGEYGAWSNAGPATTQFSLWWQAALTRQGIDLRLMGRLAPLLRDAGLQEVRQETLSIPLHGELRAAETMKTNLLAVIEGARTSILALGIDPLAFDQVVNALSQEWQQYQTSYQFHAAYGQRKRQGVFWGAGAIPAHGSHHQISSHQSAS